MKNTVFFVIFLLTNEVICQDIQSVYLSELENTKYECNIGGCTPSTMISSLDLDSCRIACLKDTQCRTVTFYKTNNQCEIFVDIPSQYGKLSNETGVITMVANDQRLSSAPERINITNPMNPCATDSLRWNKTGITILEWPQISYSMNVYIDVNDVLYIVDEYPHSVIWKLLPNSTIPTMVVGLNSIRGSNSTQFDYPQDFYIDRNQNLYVSDYFNHRIQKFINGSIDGITIAGVNSTCGYNLNQLCYPIFFTFDDTETYVYITNQFSHRIVRYLTNSTSGSNGTIVAGGSSGNDNSSLSRPYGVAYKSLLSNDLYITNSNSHSIIRWTPGAPSGIFVAGTPGYSGSTTTTLNKPMGIKLDNYLNIYVADGLNHRIQMFCAGSNKAFTIAGTGFFGSNSTQLNEPRGIAFDSDMNLYVADYQNIRIQKFIKL